MTVVVKIAIPDGIVMGADSRSTAHSGGKPQRVFDGVKKIFRLHEDYPIAVMSWGLNHLNEISLEQYMTDIRSRLEGRDPNHLDWKIDIDKVTVAELAAKVVNYLFHDHYLKSNLPQDKPAFTTMNFSFAGYSPGQVKTEHVEYSLTPDHIVGPQESRGNVKVDFHGGPYVGRIVTGADSSLPERLIEAGAKKEVVEGTLKTQGIAAMQRLVHAGMPLYELAGLVRSLINSEINFRRLGPEPDTVGGDIQLAVIDRHGCREMRFKTIRFDIPKSVWESR